jgi:hypothetical protein
VSLDKDHVQRSLPISTHHGGPWRSMEG